MDIIAVLERAIIQLNLCQDFKNSSNDLHREYGIDSEIEILEDLIDIINEKLDKKVKN